jgi:WD40 repeat protein
MHFPIGLTSVLLFSVFVSKSNSQVATQTAYFGRKFLIALVTYKLVNSAQTWSLKAQNGLLYTCRTDGFINCYNLTTNELLRTIEGHSGSCYSIVLDDQFLYSAGSDKLIKKWSLASGKLEMTFKGCLYSSG